MKGYYVFPLDGGPARKIPGLAYTPNVDAPIHWNANGKSILIAEDWQGAPQRIFRVDLATGDRKLVHVLMPVDRVGVDRILPVRIAPDGKSYAYTYRRTLSELLLVETF